MKILVAFLIGAAVAAVSCANRSPASLPYEVSKFIDVDVTCYVRGTQGISCVKSN